MNRYTIPLPEALQLAAKRRAERYANVQADLDAFRAAGCAVNINAAQLIVLEDANLLYDFETGFVEDFTPAPDNPGRVSQASRQQFYIEVAQTLPAVHSGELLQELTKEMMGPL